MLLPRVTATSAPSGATAMAPTLVPRDTTEGEHLAQAGCQLRTVPSVPADRTTSPEVDPARRVVPGSPSAPRKDLMRGPACVTWISAARVSADAGSSWNADL